MTWPCTSLLTNGLDWPCTSLLTKGLDSETERSCAWVTTATASECVLLWRRWRWLHRCVHGILGLPEGLDGLLIAKVADPHLLGKRDVCEVNVACSLQLQAHILQVIQEPLLLARWEVHVPGGDNKVHLAIRTLIDAGSEHTNAVLLHHLQCLEQDVVDHVVAEEADLEGRQHLGGVLRHALASEQGAGIMACLAQRTLSMSERVDDRHHLGVQSELDCLLHGVELIWVDVWQLGHALAQVLQAHLQLGLAGPCSVRSQGARAADKHLDEASSAMHLDASTHDAEIVCCDAPDNVADDLRGMRTIAEQRELLKVGEDADGGQLARALEREAWRQEDQVGTLTAELLSQLPLQELQALGLHRLAVHWLNVVHGEVVLGVALHLHSCGDEAVLGKHIHDLSQIVGTASSSCLWVDDLESQACEDGWDPHVAAACGMALGEERLGALKELVHLLLAAS